MLTEDYEICDILSISEITEYDMVDISVDDDMSFTLSNGLISHNSASGMFNLVRNPKVHSLLPLKGKPCNVHRDTLANVAKNDKYVPIIGAIGLGDRNNLRHGKCYISTDSDPDGLHIRLLMIQFFVKFFPWFIDEERLYVMEAPLYSYKLNGEMKYEMEPPPNGAKDVKYYKGLGSMDEEATRHMLENPRLVKISNSNKITDFYEKIYGII